MNKNLSSKNEINRARNKRNRKRNSEYFNYKRLKTWEADLNAIYDKKSKGAQIRSKVKWIAEGETNSKYFLSLEKHNQSSNNIKEIKTKDGLKINKANAILGEMLNFYEELYTSQNIQNEKNEILVPKSVILIPPSEICLISVLRFILSFFPKETRK